MRAAANAFTPCLVANTVFIEIEAGERRQRPGAEAAAAKDVLAQPWRNHRTKVTDVLECTYHPEPRKRE